MLRSLATAFTILAAVAGGAFALQSLALGRPPHARIELVRTLHALALYHRSHAHVVVDGRAHETTCRQQWTRARRSATVVVDGRHAVREVGHRLIDASPLAQTQFDLAGCPRALLTWLASELARGAPVAIRPTMRDGVRAYLLRVDASNPPLDVFVARGSGLPVALQLHGREMRGTSDLGYGVARGD